MLDIFVDADGCPVKAEVYRVADRYRLTVTLVSNMRMQVPRRDRIELVLVANDPDAADDWIVEHVAHDDIVITADIPLASRCLEKGARVIGPRGHPFTSDMIGEALATRQLLAHLREEGLVGGGPEPFSQKDRSRFLQRLDESVNAIRRSNGKM